MKEGCRWQNRWKLSLMTSHASVCNTMLVGFKSGDTVGEDAEQLRYAPPQWSCTGYHGIGWFEPSTTKDPPCRAAMHVKSVELKRPPVGVVVRRGGASSGVVHVMTMVQNYVVRRQKPSCS
ncbi:hypothetical protein TNCV_2200771 [Trichonephila clavipes]|nr:hypothetical protein TNCV_2200771 [Trichonephila clavipes]